MCLHLQNNLRLTTTFSWNGKLKVYHIHIEDTETRKGLRLDYKTKKLLKTKVTTRTSNRNVET
jgi:hypothetical protein